MQWWFFFTSLTKFFRFLTHSFPLTNSVKYGNADNMNNFTSLLTCLDFLNVSSVIEWVGTMRGKTTRIEQCRKIRSKITRSWKYACPKSVYYSKVFFLILLNTLKYGNMVTVQGFQKKPKTKQNTMTICNPFL